MNKHDLHSIIYYNYRKNLKRGGRNRERLVKEYELSTR